MTTENLATIEVIEDIFPHPDPEVERLEIAKVLNFTCVVGKGSFKKGDLCILIQPDSVLPDTEWAAPYKKFCKTRIRAVKVRGFISFGVIEKFSLLHQTENNSTHDYYVGTDVTKLLGITKYEPPAPQDLQAKGNLPFNIPKTDETLWCNIRNLKDYLGQKVDISTKYDGSSCSFYYKDGQFGVLSRSLEIKPECENKYTSHISRYNLYTKLASYCETHKVNLCLRGESYGQGIQNLKNNPHSKLPLNIAFYSVWLIDEMKYTGKGEKHYFVNVCKELDLPYVDILEEDVELTYDLIKKYDEQLEKVNGNYFEGVVVKATNFSFKIINKHYDSKK
jgi:RNA ligase (TIGR02306 family)